MGQVECSSHDFAAVNLGAGMARLGCRNCDAVVIDLDATEDGPDPVTVPGLFGPAKPTIFSVLAEERREAEKAVTARAEPASTGHRPAFAFGGPSRRR